MSNPLRAALAEKTIGDILSTKANQGAETPLLTLRRTDTIERALELSAEHNVLSLPVYNEHGRCDGLVDMHHILCYLSQEIEAGTPLEELNLKVAVHQIVDNSRWDPLLTATPETRVLDLLRWFAGGYCHRAIIGAFPTTICSQSDIISYTSSALLHSSGATQEMHELANLPASVIVDGERQHLRGTSPNSSLATIDVTTTVIDAVLRMNKYALSAVAVVDAQGRIVANLSSSDLRGLKPRDLSLLREKVTDFLSKRSPRSMHPVLVDSNTTFMQAVDLMVQHKVHRLWMVESMDAPVVRDLITMSDIMKFICNHKVGLPSSA